MNICTQSHLSGVAHRQPSAFSITDTKYWIFDDRWIINTKNNIKYETFAHKHFCQVMPIAHRRSSAFRKIQLAPSKCRSSFVCILTVWQFFFLNFVSPEEEGWIQIVDAICSHCRSEIGEKGEWVHWGRYLLLQTTISDVSQYIHNIFTFYPQYIHLCWAQMVIQRSTRKKSKYSWFGKASKKVRAQ